jgi:hypothetical protein
MPDMAPTSLESTLIDIVIIVGLLVTIVLGVRALRNRR